MAKQDDLEIQIEPEETKFEISLSTNRFKAEEIFTGVKQEGTHSETTYAKADCTSRAHSTGSMTISGACGNRIPTNLRSSWR